MQERINKIVYDTPGIVTRWEKGLCIETPLYASKEKSIPIYINEDIFYRVFDIKEKLPMEEIKTLLINAFSTTIEKERGTGDPIGTAYVDQQADPLDLSLSGNLGSGRAYYMGKYFNIKGEKTPLAQSTLRKFSDGYLEMERAIWETTIANSLQKSITTGIHPVLAIFDMNALCDVPWRDKPVKRAKIIRIDMDGALDRVTHYFHQKRPMTKKDLEHTAQSYGVLEANKYIERIVHGTWSVGNISAQGHFIDFDTVNAVKGRAPIYSSTKWHHENRFGFEYLGQMHILKSLCDDQDINIDKTADDHLSDILIETRQTHIEQGFLKLMGFNDNNHILYHQYQKDIHELCHIFTELAPKFMAPDNYLLGKTPESPHSHLYDFSFFMRIYPTLKRENIFTPEGSFQRIYQNHFENEMEKPQETYNDIEQKYMHKVYDVIGDHAVRDPMTLSFLNIAATEFIKKYDRLFTKIITDNDLDITPIAQQAYILNEDRFYLLPFFTPSFEISQNLTQAQQKIDAFMRANTRHTDQTICNIRLYNQGLYAHQCALGGMYHLCLELFDPRISTPYIVADIDGHDYVLSIEKQGDRIIYTSNPLPQKDLIPSHTRESTLHVPRILIYTHIEHNKKGTLLLDMHDMIATKDT